MRMMRWTKMRLMMMMMRRRLDWVWGPKRGDIVRGSSHPGGLSWGVDRCRPIPRRAPLSGGWAVLRFCVCHRRHVCVRGGGRETSTRLWRLYNCRRPDGHYRGHKSREAMRSVRRSIGTKDEEREEAKQVQHSGAGFTVPPAHQFALICFKAKSLND